MKLPAGALARAFSQPMQRCLKLWQAQGQDCGHAAGELWQIRLPLMTMVGLTLIGLYDCTAVRQGANPDAAPAVPAWQAGSPHAVEAIPTPENAVVTAAPKSATAAQRMTFERSQDLLHRANRLTGGTQPSFVSAAIRPLAPATRPFALALQVTLTGRTATAPPAA